MSSCPIPCHTCRRKASISGSSCYFPDARLSMNASSKAAPWLRSAFKQLSARSSPRRFTASSAFSLSKSIWSNIAIKKCALKNQDAMNSSMVKREENKILLRAEFFFSNDEHHSTKHLPYKGSELSKIVETLSELTTK